MRKLIIKTTTVKALNNDAQLQAVAGGNRYPYPRPRSAPPFLCTPGGEGAKE